MTSFVRPTTATRAPSSARQRAAAKPIPRPPPTTTAVASLSPRSTVLLLGAGPVGSALFGERDRALLRVVGREDRNDVFELLLPHLLFTPVRGLGHDLLGGGNCQRPVGRNALGEFDRTVQRLSRFGEHVDETPCLTLFGGEALTGQREFERLLVGDAFLQPQQST